MVITQTTKKERGNKRFYWSMTLNNYTEEECESVKVNLEKHCDAYLVCKEVGECGTPHLQGTLKMKKGCYKSFLVNNINKINKDRGDYKEWRNMGSLLTYCDGETEKKGISSILWIHKNVKMIGPPKPLNERINTLFEMRDIDWRRHCRGYEEASKGNTWSSEREFRYRED